MKIIGWIVSDFPTEDVVLFVDFPYTIRKVLVSKDNPVRLLSEFYKVDYEPEPPFTFIEWFAGIVGKFEPYAFFFNDSIYVKDYNFDVIVNLIGERTNQNQRKG